MSNARIDIEATDTMSDSLRRALEKIARYDASRKYGGLDEWAEAEAFHEVTRIAKEALDPEARTRRIAAQDAELAATKKRIGALRRNERYFMSYFGSDGAWVRFLKGDPDQAYNGIVRVKVLELVGNPTSSILHPGAELQVNVCNLYIDPTLAPVE